MSNSAFPHLSMAFIKAMDEIGRHGFTKYGELPQERSAHCSPSRVTTEAIKGHAAAHFQMYQDGVLHDHFQTPLHQLAAVAFNAMMEAQFAGFVENAHEPSPLPQGEEFILYLDEEGDYIIKAQREGRSHFLVTDGQTPGEAVMNMRKLLDAVSLLGYTTEELMEAVQPCR